MDSARILSTAGGTLQSIPQTFAPKELPTWRQNMPKFSAPFQSNLAGAVYYTKSRDFTSLRSATSSPQKSPWANLPLESKASLGNLTLTTFDELARWSCGDTDDDDDEATGQTASVPVILRDEAIPLTVKDSILLEANRVKDDISNEKSHNMKTLVGLRESVTDFLDFLKNPVSDTGEKWEFDLYKRTGGPLEIAKTWKMSTMNKQMQADPDLLPDS